MTDMSPEVLYACLGKVIIQKRKDMGLTQDALAKKSKVDRAFLSAVERGKGQPSFGTVSKLARGLDMRCSKLVRLCESIESVALASLAPPVEQPQPVEQP